MLLIAPCREQLLRPILMEKESFNQIYKTLHITCNTQHIISEPLCDSSQVLLH